MPSMYLNLSIWLEMISSMILEQDTVENFSQQRLTGVEVICSFAVREAEKRGAEYAEAYMTKSKESEVFIENNDLKQLKYHKNSGLGIRVFVDGSLGFSSVNVLEREPIKDAAMQAIKLARVSP